MVVENGIIESVHLGKDDYGYLTMSLNISGGHFNIIFGGAIILALATPEENLTKSDMGNYAGYYITKVMEVADCSSLADIKNKPVRIILSQNGGAGSTCIGIQHFLKKNVYFIPHDKDLENDNINDIL